MFSAGTELHRVDVHVLLPQVGQVTATDIAVMFNKDGVFTGDLSEFELEHTATEDRMLFSRRLTLVPLARNVGYAVHVMVWLSEPTCSIFPRFDAF